MISERFRAALGSAVQWCTVVSWTNDGTTWQRTEIEPNVDGPRLQSGTVTRSLSDQVHWKAALQLVGVTDDLSGMNPYTTRVRIRHGIRFGPGDYELLNFGLYRVSDTDDLGLRQPGISVSLSSYEDFIIRAKLQRPKRYGGQSAAHALEQVIWDVCPGAPVRWDPRIADMRGVPVPATLVPRERWDFVDGLDDSNSIAAAIGGRVVTDADGGFLVIPTPTLQDEPVGEIARGEGGLLVDRSQQRTSDDVANVVVVTGTSTSSDDVIGPVIVKDTDPTSPTYYARPISAGGFGEIPYFFESSLIRDEAQARRAARAKLAARLGLRQSVTLDSLHDPTKVPGSVYTVLDSSDRVIFDALTYDLNGGSLQGETRAQQTVLDGGVVDLPTLDGGEGMEGV